MKMEKKKPLAYLTKANCLWMKDPNYKYRYIPNPNAKGSYDVSYCEERGCIPIYDKRLIERFKKLKEDEGKRMVPK